MTWRWSYPFDYRDCGASIRSDAERYYEKALCRECGLKRRREQRAVRLGRTARTPRTGTRRAPLSQPYPFQCRDCDATIASQQERWMTYRRCVPCGRRYQKGYNLRRYNITPDQVDALVAACGGRCPICRNERKLVVDHDHQTGVVRGVLCDPCNQLIGLAGEDSSVLVAALRYLEKHKRGAVA